MHPAIYDTYAVLWCCTDLWSFGGGGGISLPWVYVHSAICETSTVQWFSRELCLTGEGGIRSVYHGYMCILLSVKLIWCGGFPDIYA